MQAGMPDKAGAPAEIGLDDGYAFTKVALPDGRLVSVASRARIGRAGVTWLDGSKPRAFEYETGGTVFSAGEVEAEPTRFDDYPHSGLNRAIVQHALQAAGLGGRSVHAVSGLPVGSFYFRNGTKRDEHIRRKRESLRQAASPLDGRVAASVAFHEIIPEALAAWYDDVIVEADGGVLVEGGRLQDPVAVVDIGGRTTDFVVVAEQAVRHASSGSLRCGLLDLHRQVSEAIRQRFDLESLSDGAAQAAVKGGRVRLFAQWHDVSEIVGQARGELLERLHAETRRQLGRGAELERIVFVGGGAVALAGDIAQWFPNQSIAPHPAFANARGMLKYLRYVCPDAREG